VCCFTTNSLRQASSPTRALKPIIRIIRMEEFGTVLYRTGKILEFAPEMCMNLFVVKQRGGGDVKKSAGGGA